MKELFDSLPITAQSVDYLLDTCFLFYILEHRQEKRLIRFCGDNNVALSTFTIEEFVHHHHHMSHEVKTRIRHLLNNGLSLSVVDVPVSPGDPAGERSFVSSVDDRLLSLIPDPSDAVLFAVAIRHHANLITRDKHHLFTTVLENYSHDLGLSVLNNFP
ncbi:MAG: PIN domain-containing protein [Nanobdellota archaeon]